MNYMNKFLLFLIIISIYILSKKKNIYEGISNVEETKEETNGGTKGETNGGTKEETKKENHSKDDCPYRLKKNLGKMCNEKWGQPDCNVWEKTENVKDLEKNKTNILKGYYSNDYMYEIDYEKYSTIPIEEGNVEEIDENTPRGIHSSFFS